jgi:2-methylcitrate dehydratase
VEIVLDLATKHHLESDAVENIVVKTYEFAAMVPGQIRTDPGSNPLLCQFSTPYCVAVALIDKKLGLEQLSPERVKDPMIHQLASRVEVVADSEMERLRPANRPAIVEISLNSGQKLVGRVDYPKGDPRNPMSERELSEKFMDLASQVLTGEKAEKLHSAVLDLEGISDVSEIVELCSKP